MTSLERKLKRVRPLLGTFVEITLQARAEATSLHAWMTAGFDAVTEVDRLMSAHRADSEISRLNQAAPGTWVDIHPWTLTVLQASHSLYLASGGVFDIRREAVSEGSAPPVMIRGSRVQKTGAAPIDLGGIAKGFAVDRAVETIQRLTAGYRVSGAVNAGGDMRLWGCGSVPAAAQIQGQGTFWLRPFVVNETAAATSSVRTRTADHLAPAVHLQMPSGVPLKKEQTVTVFASRCLWADALTKVVLLAPEKIARACLATYRAKALVFNPGGLLQEVLS